MLVLNRSDGQTILVGDDVVISVVEVRGKNVRLGIEAPNDKKILRGELKRRDEGPQFVPLKTEIARRQKKEGGES